jgi:hypothetical protein
MPPEPRNVPAPWKLDDNVIRCTRSGIIVLQRPPQPAGFHPHDGVSLRVEILPTPQCLGADRVALDAVTFAAKGRLDDKPKKRR